MHSSLPTESEGERIASDLVSTKDISGDDEEDTTLLRKMSEDARRYISSFAWCDAILSSYFGGGLGGVFAVFLFHIRPGLPSVDPWIWVAVGDVPAAYLPVSDCKSPVEFFRTYIRGMSKWVELARFGRVGTPEDGVPPVNALPTPERAEDLSRRLSTLRLVVQPFFESDSDIVH